MAEGDGEAGYAEWRCTNCGHGVPKHNPPCSRCGNMGFERVEVRASDFDDETVAASTRQILRENARLAAVAAAVVAVVLVATLAGAGVFVVSDPFGLGYRYGAVPAETPDDDGRLTAAELHGRAAAAHAETSLAWSGRRLDLAFRSDARSDDELAADLTGVAVAYADYVAGGGDAARLRVTARLPGDRRARVTVARADAAAFAAGEITRETYRDRVLGG
jgi:hypothetical protein